MAARRVRGQLDAVFLNGERVAVVDQRAELNFEEVPPPHLVRPNVEVRPSTAPRSLDKATHQWLVAFANRWAFNNRSFPWLDSVTFLVDGDEVQLVVRGRVAPSADAFHALTTPIEFQTRRSFHLRELQSAIVANRGEWLRHWVRQCLRETVLHELEESTWFDGALETDPHARDPR